MSRLVIAVLILFAVLLGLRITSSSLFQRNVANQLASTPATRTTGFSTEATANNPGTAQSQGLNAPSTTYQGTGTTTTTQPADTTPLPPSQQPAAIPGGW